MRYALRNGSWRCCGGAVSRTTCYRNQFQSQRIKPRSLSVKKYPVLNGTRELIFRGQRCNCPDRFCGSNFGKPSLGIGGNVGVHCVVNHWRVRGRDKVKGLVLYVYSFCPATKHRVLGRSLESRITFRCSVDEGSRKIRGVQNPKYGIHIRLQNMCMPYYGI
jgi:hypothetical protein